LFSALLLTLEGLGIDLGDHPIPGINVDFHNAKPMVPLILIALAGYFSFRLSLEWFHLDPTFRSKIATRFDLAVTALIISAALGVFLWNRLSAVALPTISFPLLASPIFLGAMVGWWHGLLRARWSIPRFFPFPVIPSVYLDALSVCLLVGTLVFTLSSGALKTPSYELALSVGLGYLIGRFVAGCYAFWWRHVRRSWAGYG